MREIFTDKRVLTNIVLLIIAIISACGVNVGIDPGSVNAFVAILATALNGGLHAATATGD